MRYTFFTKLASPYKRSANTYKLFAERLYGEANFVKNVYRIFFASQLLTNLDKMKANDMVKEGILFQLGTDIP